MNSIAILHPLLKIITDTANRIGEGNMKEIITDLIDEYIERRKETLEILSKPEWMRLLSRGKQR